MKKFDNVIEKFAKSSSLYSEKYYFDDEDILAYFEKMVNTDKFIQIPRFDLEISYDKNINKIYHIDYDTKKVIFYKEMFFRKCVDEKKNAMDSFNLNLQLIEHLNKVISKITLFRMLCNPMSFKIDPVFFCSVVKHKLNNSKNEEADYFINLYSKYLTTEIMNLATSDYKLNNLEELYFHLNTNKLILKYIKDIDNNPLIYSFGKYYDSISLYEPRKDEEIINILGPEIGKNYIDAIDIDINTIRINYNNLLSSILYCKPIKEHIVQKLVSISKKDPVESIFLYAKNKQLEYQDEMTQNLLK